MVSDATPSVVSGSTAGLELLSTVLTGGFVGGFLTGFTGFWGKIIQNDANRDNCKSITCPFSHFIH